MKQFRCSLKNVLNTVVFVFFKGKHDVTKNRTLTKSIKDTANAKKSAVGITVSIFTVIFKLKVKTNSV